MRTTFLDTVGLLAIWDSRDTWHNDATPVFSELRSQRVRLYTSNLVLLECANAAARTRLRVLVVEFREEMLDAGCVLLPTEQDMARAWEAFGSGHPGQPGVVDLISFELMRQYRIKDVFSNDVHFKVAGFRTLF